MPAGIYLECCLLIKSLSFRGTHRVDWFLENGTLLLLWVCVSHFALMYLFNKVNTIVAEDMGTWWAKTSAWSGLHRIFLAQHATGSFIWKSMIRVTIMISNSHWRPVIWRHPTTSWGDVDLSNKRHTYLVLGFIIKSNRAPCVQPENMDVPCWSTFQKTLVKDPLKTA